jgi:hypothetical protein
MDNMRLLAGNFHIMLAYWFFDFILNFNISSDMCACSKVYNPCVSLISRTVSDKVASNVFAILFGSFVHN